MPAVELGSCKIDMSADGKYVAAIGTKWVNVYSTDQGDLIHEIRVKSGNAVKSTTHPSRPLLFLSTDNATVEVLDLNSGETVGVVAARGKGSPVDNMAFLRSDDISVVGEVAPLFDVR